MKIIIKVSTAILFALALLCTAVYAQTAEELTNKIQIETNIAKANILDGSLTSYSGGENISVNIKSDTPIGGIYLRFRTPCVKGTLDTDTTICENGFLAEYIDLSDTEKYSARLFFEKAEICELQVFSKGDVPREVQRWVNTDTDTDLLLLATHSDDDQLFFAGLLPYYTAREGTRVRVAYFVSHHDAPARLHELLSGLWECGVKYYPEIGIFPDAYSESFQVAKTNLERAGCSYESVLDYQRYLLNKYKPQVVVLHDFAGEYSHGQHIINTKSFVEVLENTQSGQHMPKKVYVHLYGENVIKLDIDTPLSAFDGRSAFAVSQDAFRHHRSQHWTWFYRWIYGSAGNITSSSQIKSYNPALYGLYYSSVGTDTENDMLENITLYRDIEKAKREAELERIRAEEERKNAEAEKAAKEAEKLWREAEETRKTAEKRTKNLAIVLLAAIPAVLLSAFGTARIFMKKRK